jgi:hypothetical protein
MAETEGHRLRQDLTFTAGYAMHRCRLCLLMFKGGVATRNAAFHLIPLLP